MESTFFENFLLSYDSTGTILINYNELYVNVPVLSNHITFIDPAAFIFGGLIQLIFFCFNLLKEKVIPIDIAAGKAGGTVIVIISKNPITISAVSH